MCRWMLSCLAMISLAISTTPAHAEVVTIDGRVKSVDAKKRTITVETGSKTLTLDVSSKAKVSVDGKESNLNSLKAGQKVNLSYHDKLEVVLRIRGELRGASADNHVVDDYLFDMDEHDLIGRFPQTFRRPFTVSGKKVTKGLILHPSDNGVSHVSFDLGGRYERFSGSIAIWDHAANRTKTPLVFEISADQETIWKSAPAQKTAVPQKFVVQIVGKNNLELRVICPGPSDFANAVWIDPKLSRRK